MSLGYFKEKSVIDRPNMVFCLHLCTFFSSFDFGTWCFNFLGPSAGISCICTAPLVSGKDAFSFDKAGSHQKGYGRELPLLPHQNGLRVKLAEITYVWLKSSDDKTSTCSWRFEISVGAPATFRYAQAAPPPLEGSTCPSGTREVNQRWLSASKTVDAWDLTHQNWGHLILQRLDLSCVLLFQPTCWETYYTHTWTGLHRSAHVSEKGGCPSPKISNWIRKATISCSLDSGFPVLFLWGGEIMINIMINMINSYRLWW